ncbi:MAG: polymer-forming cytoskeletal protein [Oscillospiraceae bacterium]|nr:polymer-forming cytoskeletal protein [Oscillospiraceae bacterium]
MDMKIAGSGVITAGEYDKVGISGSVKSEGLIRCKEFRCSGAFSGNSDIECEGDMHISGAFSNRGTLSSKEFNVSGSAKNEGRLSSDIIKVSGAFKVEGDCASDEKISVSGGFKCGGTLRGAEVKISGGLKVSGDFEAEDAYITGGISCGGLINAENLRIELSNSYGSKAESIGGSKIIIENYREKGIIEKLFGRKKFGFAVSESIEGDEIIIERTSAKTVTGKYVMIGEDCDIGLVQYSESVEISPKAKVGKCEKI